MTSVVKVRRWELPAMPVILRLPLGVAGVVGALGACVLGVLVVANVAIVRGFDRWAFAAAGGYRWTPSFGRSVADAVDFAGEPVGAMALVGVLILAASLGGRPRSAVLCGTAPFTAAGVTRVLKPVVGRQINGGNFSFPSGHTALFTAAAFVAALLVVQLLGLGRVPGTALVVVVSAVAAVAMGWSQTTLLAHYPTDTVGGYFVAVAVVPVMAALIDRMRIPYPVRDRTFTDR